MRKLAWDAGVVAGVAAVTACAILAVARPHTVVAEGEAKAAPIERPTLKVDGVILTLVADKSKYEAGETPTLTLTAVNPGTSPASLDAVVTMMSAEQGPPMGRMRPMLTEVWRHECALQLAPGETKVIEVATDKRLAAGQSGSFNVVVGKKTLAAVWFSVPGGKQLAPKYLDYWGSAELPAATQKPKAKPGAPASEAKSEAEAK